MGAFRSKEMEEKYRQYREAGHLDNGCKLCAETSLKDFNFWRIITNNFPYDKVARVHHMLIPKRCVEEKDLTASEKDELVQIKYGYVNDTYGHIVEAVKKGKSIPIHIHLHLLTLDE